MVVHEVSDIPRSLRTSSRAWLRRAASSSASRGDSLVARTINISPRPLGRARAVPYPTTVMVGSGIGPFCRTPNQGAARSCAFERVDLRFRVDVVAPAYDVEHMFEG